MRHPIWALLGFVTAGLGGCVVEDEADVELRFADAVAEACQLDQEDAEDYAVGQTPICTKDGAKITDEATCEATKCGPQHDQTDCFWAGALRGCRCPSGACTAAGD